MRKCGAAAIKSLASDKYINYLKNVLEVFL